MESIRAAVVQFQHRPGDKKHNLGIVRRFAECAAGQGVRLLVFPEMCITGYWHMRHLDQDGVGALAEPVGPSTQALSARAHSTGMTIGAGLIEVEFRGPKGREWLLTWLPARVHDNGLFLLYSNGVGIDDDEVRTGNAMILGPYGRILAETWKARDQMVIADLDPALRHMCTGVRWIRSRRPELYGELALATGREEDTRTVRFEQNGTDA